MITKDELRKLFVSTETYRVERTVSTTDKDKFGEAVCAFANDMPDTGKPGYLLVGVRDGGQLSGLKATDELLQKFASLRSDGNILPIPTIAVDSFSFPDGDVIVVEVQPSHQPPVRYRGRTWIRIGPRRDIATLDEEIMLAERKARHFSTFDARPCFQSSIADLDLDLFLHDYLPKAVSPEALAGDDRSVERKLESLRLFNGAYGVPTNAAILLFGKNPKYFFPGAYVQYVNFGGLDKAATIINEHPFHGPIVRILPQIDLFIETTISRKRPVFVSALREEMRVDYPKGAIRELVMNAIMHRDYQGNAPIHFYQYSDRLEVVNHGGLYGRARPENFPNVSDYRNPIIAEAMKVMGYVNCYNRGIGMVQDELEANGNGKAEFSFRLITAFETKVAKATRDESQKSASATHKDGMESGAKRVLGEKLGEKLGERVGKKRLQIIELMAADAKISISALAQKIGISQTAIENNLRWLKTNNIIRRIGSAKGGYWEVVEVMGNQDFKQSSLKRRAFVLRSNGADAHGSTGFGQPFVVLRGSLVSSRVMPSLKGRTPSYYRLRKQLEAEGVIVDRIFVRDYEFASPSAASSVVSGRPSNGRLDWMASDGRRLREVQEEWRE